MQDVDDINFSLNALCIDYSNLSDYRMVIDEDKMKYLNENKRGIMECIGFDRDTKNNIINMILQKVNENYIYNLEYMDKYNVMKFNVCIELTTKNENLRRTTVVLEYKPKEKEIRLITLT